MRNMTTTITKKARLAAGLISLLALFALINQLPITIASFVADGGTASGGVWRFFGYFTITTNTLCAIVMGLVALGHIKSESVLGAVTSYVLIMCLVYWLLLSGDRHLTGWPALIDSILHYGVPFVTLAAWVTIFPRRGLTWADPFKWLIYPVGYSIYSMSRGAIEGWYPYFFLDVTTLGLGKVALNIAGLACLFLVTGLVLVALARAQKQTKQAA
jgi:hypothetical protein